MIRDKLEIDLTEDDINEFYAMLHNNETITWTFNTANGQKIDIEFMSTDEKEERDK